MWPWKRSRSVFKSGAPLAPLSMLGSAGSSGSCAPIWRRFRYEREKAIIKGVMLGYFAGSGRTIFLGIGILDRRRKTPSSKASSVQSIAVQGSEFRKILWKAKLGGVQVGIAAREGLAVELNADDDGAFPLLFRLLVIQSE